MSEQSVRMLFDDPEREEWRLPDAKDGTVIRHREDGPAVISTNGYKAWYKNGLRHRTDGPAIEFDDFKCWYVEGKAHRTDGPAMVFSEKKHKPQYWINGIRQK